MLRFDHARNTWLFSPDGYEWLPCCPGSARIFADHGAIVQEA